VTIDSLALAVIKPAAVADARSWVALSARVSNASFVAPASLPFHVSATDLTLEINTKDTVESKFVDFSAQSLLVATGPSTSRTLDFGKAFLRATGTVDLDVASFVQVRNVSFAFEKTDLADVPLTTGGAPR